MRHIKNGYWCIILLLKTDDEGSRVNSFCAWHSIEHLPGYKLGLVSLVGLAVNVVGEEEQLEHEKDNHKFDEDDGPERFAYGHLPESIVVEMEDLIWESMFHAELDLFLDFAKIRNLG